MTARHLGEVHMATTEERDEFRVPKGAVIFRQGDPGHEMFVVSEGRIRLTIGQEGHEKEVALLGPGEFFGELSLLGGAIRTATAQAVEDSTLLAIGRDAFSMLVQDDLEIVFRMMNIQGQRLSQTNQPIEQLMQRLGRVRVVAHCLKRFLKGNGQVPLMIDTSELATELDVGKEVVRTVLAELAQRGAGMMQDQRWSLTARDQADKLVDLLCAFSDGRAD
jgi:CRP/FNR family transcriptional regulator, cyclic AMP receptor protein